MPTDLATTDEFAIEEARHDTRRNQPGPKDGPPKTIHIGCNVDPEMREAIFQRAIADQITISEWLRRAIENAL